MPKALAEELDILIAGVDDEIRNWGLQREKLNGKRAGLVAAREKLSAYKPEHAPKPKQPRSRQ